MITFEITQKPNRTLMTVEDVEVEVGIKYNIALESTIKLENETSYFGEPFDIFKYKINNDLVPSVNEGNVLVSFETNKSQNPVIITASKTLPLFESFLFSSEVLPNQFYDRITITNILGKGSWFFNGNPVIIGQSFFYYELVSNLSFIADELGVKTNYAEINWTTGTILENHIGVNSLVVNTTSDGAELILSNSNGPTIDEFGVEKYTYFVTLQKSMSNANYKINVDTSGFPDIGGDEKIEIVERNLPLITINTLGVTEIISVLDDNGGSTYVISIYKLASTAVENNIVLTLTEVDGTIANINPLYNQIILIIPITPTP